MLKVVAFSHSHQKLEFLELFDEKAQTWLVSDLRSKFELQGHFLELADAYEDHSILRASELWRLLLRRLRPELRLAPREFLMAWLTDFLKKVSLQSGETLLQPQSAKTFVALMDLFVPVFLSPKGSEHLEEFFAAHPNAADKWRDWVHAADTIFQGILKENWVLSAWVPALLAQESGLESCWERPLWVDLGAGLRQMEVELLRRLSRVTDVTVFIPQLKNPDAFSFLLQPTQELRTHATVVKDLPSPELDVAKPLCFRFSGPLAEVKQTVAQVRQWLEQGVLPHQIAIVAPEIEDYWPLLEPFLENEGIPVQKASVTRLQSWPSISSWLSRLRLRAGQVSYADLATGLNTDDLNLRFEKFRSLFINAMESEDVTLNPALKDFFARGSAPSQDLNLESFMAWTAGDWRDSEDWDGFEILLKEILQTVPSHVQMSLDGWMGYLERKAASLEVRLKSPDLAGIALINLSSVEGSDFQRRIFLGLTESNFRKRTTLLVGAQELGRLGWDFGYFLDHPEQNLRDFELHWALQSPSPQDLLFFPSTGLGATSEAPHPLWLAKGGSEKVQVPLATRWDEIQNSSLPLLEKLERDLRSEIRTDALLLKEVPRFSISSLERFRNCRFQFAAEKWFHLQDYPERDLDLDARSKGSLAHKLFETLSLDPRRFDHSADEIRELIEKLRHQVRLGDREGLFWEIEKERYVQLGLRFLSFEKSWSQRFPHARIEAREKEFQFYFNPETGEFSAVAQAVSVEIRGAIDRIETDGRGFKLILDYKTAHQREKNFTNWHKENQLQLGFYAWVVDRGFVKDLSPGTVAGAMTFGYKRMEKKGGFAAPEILDVLAAKTEPNDASMEKKEEFYAELEILLKELLREALEGRMEPAPLNQKILICDRCQWSEVCRAPHLTE